jgi:hypothetical protein
MPVLPRLTFAGQSSILEVIVRGFSRQEPCDWTAFRRWGKREVEQRRWAFGEVGYATRASHSHADSNQHLKEGDVSMVMKRVITVVLAVVLLSQAASAAVCVLRQGAGRAEPIGHSG